MRYKHTCICIRTYINNLLTSLYVFQTPNSDLVYFLDRVENVPFFIDQNTGRLTVQNVLDYEAATVYNVSSYRVDKWSSEPIDYS